MNDYLTRKQAEYDALHAEVSAIAEHLGGTLLPSTLENNEIPWFIHVALENEPFQLYFTADSYRKKLNVMVAHWPSYTDTDGRKQTIYPSRYSMTGPETFAAHGRPAKAVAGQIVRNVIEPARPIWDKLQAAANDAQAYANESRDGFLRLAENLGSDTQRYLDGHGAYLYVRNIPGDSFRIEYRSPGDVLLSGLPVDDVIVMLNALREHRANKAA